jgi:hypothetical protein
VHAEIKRHTINKEKFLKRSLILLVLSSTALFIPLHSETAEEMLARLTSQFHSAQTALAEKNAEWQKQMSSLSNLDTKFKELKKDAELVARRSVSAGAAAAGKLTSKLREKVATLTSKKNELEEEQAKLKKEKEELEQSKTELTAKQVALETKNKELEENKAALSKAKKELEDEKEHLTIQVDELEGALESERKAKAKRLPPAGEASGGGTSFAESTHAPQVEKAAKPKPETKPVVHEGSRETISSLEGEASYKLSVAFLKKDKSSQEAQLTILKPTATNLDEIEKRSRDLKQLQVSFENLKELEKKKRTQDFFPSLPETAFTDHKITEAFIEAKIALCEKAYLGAKEAERKATELKEKARQDAQRKKAIDMERGRTEAREKKKKEQAEKAKAERERKAAERSAKPVARSRTEEHPLKKVTETATPPRTAEAAKKEKPKPIATAAAPKRRLPITTRAVTKKRHSEVELSERFKVKATGGRETIPTTNWTTRADKNQKRVHIFKETKKTITSLKTELSRATTSTKQTIYNKLIIALQKLAPLFWEGARFQSTGEYDYTKIANSVVEIASEDIKKNVIQARVSTAEKKKSKKIYSSIVLSMKNAKFIVQGSTVENSLFSGGGLTKLRSLVTKIRDAR